MKLIFFLSLLSHLVLAEHDPPGGASSSAGESVEAAKISLANVAREVQRAGVKRVYFDIVQGEPTVESYKRREKILRGVLKLAKSKNLGDLLIDGIEFETGNALTKPKPDDRYNHYRAGEDAPWEKFNELLEKAPARIESQRDPNRKQAKRIAVALGDDMYVTQFHVGASETKKIYDIVEKLTKEGLRLKAPARSIGVSEDYGTVPSLQKTGGDTKPFLIIPPNATEEKIRTFFESKK